MIVQHKFMLSREFDDGHVETYFSDDQHEMDSFARVGVPGLISQCLTNLDGSARRASFGPPQSLTDVAHLPADQQAPQTPSNRGYEFI